MTLFQIPNILARAVTRAFAPSGECARTEALGPSIPGVGARAGALASFRGAAKPRSGSAPQCLGGLWRSAFLGGTNDTQGDRLATGRAADHRGGNHSVALVGAGPGAKDLITLRGVRRLEAADIVFFDRLVDPELLDLTRPEAELVYVGKAPGRHSWSQARISEALVVAAQQGKRVVRLKCGDPGVFARGAEEADALRMAGIDYEIVPGVTAASAAAAATGGFLTERGTIDTLVLTTGRTEVAGADADWLPALRPGCKVAIYMGVAEAGRIEATLEDHAWRDHIQVEIVADAQMPGQRALRCGPTAIADTLRGNGIKNRTIIFLSLPKDCALASGESSLRFGGEVEQACV